MPGACECCAMVAELDQPKVIVSIVTQCCPVILTINFCPSSLQRLCTGKMNMMHVAQIETLIAPENGRQFIAGFVVVEVCSEVFEQARSYRGS